MLINGDSLQELKNLQSNSILKFLKNFISLLKKDLAIRERD